MVRAFLRNENGSAAEFALILPVAMLMFFGIIDGGLYLWGVNQAEKATQAGARIAAVTAMIPQGVANYSYATTGGVQQGQPVGTSDFPGVTCVGTDTSVTCNWLSTPNNNYSLEPSNAAFTQIFERMQQFMPQLERSQVRVVYANSGLGFSGDPNGPDVAPLITVSIEGATYSPSIIGLAGATWGLPEARYSLTQEDGTGVCFEEHPGANSTGCDLG